MTAGVWVDLPNLRFPFDGICSGGRPRPPHLRQAADGGVKLIVSLCAASEYCGYDEAELAQSLGMRYVNIPIAGPPDLTAANARKLADALHQVKGSPVLVHCASGNRVGALFALKAHFVDGLAAEPAVTVGRSAGLTTLEPTVRYILAGY
jgi:protein tyrosine phosphatase (PTP) superfamily phosphohydrolase (DUF442 family)